MPFIGWTMWKDKDSYSREVKFVKATSSELLGSGCSGAEAARSSTDPSREVDALELKPGAIYPPGIERPASDTEDSSVHSSEEGWDKQHLLYPPGQYPEDEQRAEQCRKEWH